MADSDQHQPCSKHLSFSDRFKPHNAFESSRTFVVQPFLSSKISTPSQTLCYDVLVIIFQFCFVDSASPQTKPSIHPYTLAAVCQHWRSVAFTTPELWTQFWVIWDNHSQNKGKLWPKFTSWQYDIPNISAISRQSSVSRHMSLKEEIIKWYNRSSHRGITLHFNLSFHTDPSEIQQLLNDDYSVPLRNLHLKGPYSKLSDVFGVGLPDCFGLLPKFRSRKWTDSVETITLEPTFLYNCSGGGPTRHANEELLPPIDISFFNSITYLSLIGAHPLAVSGDPDRKFITGIQYKQLTRIEIVDEFLPLNIIFRFLNECSNLVTCTLMYAERCSLIQQASVNIKTRIPLQHLQSLVVKFHRPKTRRPTRPISGFFNQIMTPAIEHLALHFVYNGLVIKADIEAMLEGSRDTLKSVRLHEFDRCEEEQKVKTMFPRKEYVVISYDDGKRI